MNVKISELIANTPKGSMSTPSEITSGYETISFNDAGYALQREIWDNDSYWNEDDEEHTREEGHRYSLWLLCLMLHFYGRDNDENRRVVDRYRRDWKIDESIYYEMKDIAENYKALYQDGAGGLPQEFRDELKRSLDKAIETLIKRG
ncbi:MAG: hypothetical protein IJP89_04020 [Synergistaceae bacterium]|nr:hypothetical protein [Synergistaceae bacterium]